MHINHLWEGEQPLANDTILTSVAIDTIERGSPADLKAKGELAFTDCHEGFGKECAWEATATLNGTSWIWSVKRRVRAEEATFQDSSTGEPAFTRIEEVNTAIRDFVSAQLSELTTLFFEG